MTGDPYLNFWGAVQRQSDSAAGLPPVAEGVVTSAAPLKITAVGLPFTGSDLQVNELLSDPEKPLESGDRVLCLSLDGWQTLYILCKVVAA